MPDVQLSYGRIVNQESTRLPPGHGSTRAKNELATNCRVEVGDTVSRCTQSLRRCVWYLRWLLCVAMLTGCSDQLPTYPVRGRVEFKGGGGPVHVGTVELKSLDHGVQARGEIQDDGSFTLTTYQPGDGAVAGRHACVVVQFVMTEELAGHMGSKVGVIDRRYNSYATSGLQIEIQPHKTNEVLILVDGILKSQPEEHQHPDKKKR